MCGGFLDDLPVSLAVKYDLCRRLLCIPDLGQRCRHRRRGLGQDVLAVKDKRIQKGGLSRLDLPYNADFQVALLGHDLLGVPLRQTCFFTKVLHKRGDDELLIAADFIGDPRDCIHEMVECMV